MTGTPGTCGTASSVSGELFAERALSSTRELGRGLSVGVTGFGPYDMTVGMAVWDLDLSRAAASSSRSMLRSGVQ